MPQSGAKQPILCIVGASVREHNFVQHFGEGIARSAPRVRVGPLAVMPRQCFRQKRASRLGAQAGAPDVRSTRQLLHDPVRDLWRTGFHAPPHLIASASESRGNKGKLDCVVARAPRNDG
jgi:hypothetical protein